jgi:ribosomal protein L31E
MWMTVLAVALTAVPGTASAKDAVQQFKTVEAKHFKEAEGVELSPIFADYLYAELRNELAKAKLANEVIGEGEAVDDADAAKSALITGTITEYKKGSVVKSALIGFGAGMRSLKVDADVLRRSDNQNLCVLHVHVKVDPRWDEKIMAKWAAKQMVNEMKKAFKERPLS